MRRAKVADKILLQYRHSSALQRIGCSLKYICRDIRRDQRKLIPVTELARRFDVSRRLLWKWIAEGFIARGRAKRSDGEMKQKRGVPKRTVLRFLKMLESPASLFGNPDFYPGDIETRWSPALRVVSRAGRPDTAQQKIREAKRIGLSGQGMNPRQFAKMVGVSRSAVWRAIESRHLPSWKPTPHRTLIGYAPKKPKKTKRGEIDS